jgi:hypothetical protein
MNAAFDTFRFNQSPQSKQNRLRLWGKSKRIDSLNIRNVSMKKSDIVGLLVTLPRRFYSLGNISMFSLLEVTGYFGIYEQVSEADIRAALVRHPECVQEWFHYSEDKRTSLGWYLTENDGQCYETGYIADAQTRTNRVQHDNTIGACAVFIQHELEDIRRA